MSVNRSRARRTGRHTPTAGATRPLEARYRALLDAMPDMIFRLDGEGRFLDFSPAKGLEPTLPPAEFLGRTVREVMPPDIAAEIMLHVEQALQTGDTQVFEYQLPVPLPNGDLHDFEARVVVSGDDEVLAVVRDVTGTTRAREALRESEAKYRQVFEHVHDVFFRTDIDGVITELSPSTEWWGYNPEDLIGSHVADFYADLQVRPDLQKALLEQGRIVDQHIRLKVPDGRVLDASVSFHLLRGPDGAPAGIEGIARDVSGRMRAEEALEESEQRLRSLVTHAPVALFAVDSDGVFTAAEGETVSLVGLRSDEYVGRSVFDMFRDMPGVIDAARRALAGEAFTTTVELQGRTFEANVAPVRDEGGKIKGAVAVGTDITERARAEARLRVQRDLALALSATTDLQETLRLCLQAAICVAEFDSGCVYLRDRSSGAFHVACHEGLGDEFMERILRFEADSPYVQAAMTGEPLYTLYEELVTQMDEPRRREGLCAMAAVPIQHGGEVIACLCVASHSRDDIPSASRSALEAIAARIGSAIARSQADEALRESEERFRRLSEATLEGIIIGDPDVCLDANEQAAAMVGCEVPEVLGKDPLSFLLPEWREIVRKHVTSASDEFCEAVAVKQDGTTFPVEVRGRTASYQGQEVRISVVRDLTEHKRAEQALRESEERFRGLAEGSVDGILLVAGLEVRFANAALVEMLGYASDEEILSRPFTELVAAEYREMMVEWGRARDEGRPAPARYEFRPLRKDGTEFPAEISVSTITYQGGRVRLGIIRDITERKQAEEALRDSEERFRGLAESSIDGIVLVEGPDVRFANAALVKMLGYRSDEEILGRPFADFLSPDYREMMVGWRRAREEGRDAPSQYEFRPLRKDGSEFDAEVSVSAMVYRGRLAGLGIIRDITERKRAEEALRESEAKFRTLVDTAPAAVLIYRGTRPLYFNAATERLTGYTREEISGMELWQFAHPDFQRLVRERSRARQRGKPAPSRYEFKIVTKGGEERWLDFTAGMIEFGGQPAVIGMGYDITERKRAGETLRESEERFRGLSEAALEGIVIHDGTVVLDANPQVAAMHGYEVSEIIGMDPLSFVAPESRELVRQNVVAGIEEPYEVLGLKKDGTTFPMEVCAKIISYEGREVRVGVVRDITERKRAEEALRESERQYRLLADNATDVIWTTDLDLNFTYSSPSTKELLGLSSWPAPIPSGAEILTPASLEVARKTLAEELAVENKKRKDLSRSRTLELEICRIDGSTVWIEASMTFLRDPDSRPVGILGVTREITERKRAEEALRESEERYRSLVEASPDAITLTDLDLNIIMCNEQAAWLHGFRNAEELLSSGKNALDLIAPEDRQRAIDNALKTQGRGAVTNVEYALLRQDGTSFPGELSASLITDADGTPKAFTALTRDITERKRAEEALRESESRFRTLSDASFEGIAIHDKGPIVDGNQAFASMFGYELSETIGMHVLDFVAPESHDLVLSTIVSKFREPFEFTGLRKDGTTFPAEVCARAIPYRGKTVAVAALRDLTESKQMEEALQKAREELEARVEHQMERVSSYGLTFRELTVLYLMAAGRADKEIALQLGISSRTASKHVENILQKMGVASRTQASVQAFREGLVGDVP